MKEGFKSLIVWQKSKELAKEVYKITAELPSRENFALADQMRRSAISIPSNIAEGSRRGSKKDFAHFLSMAHGSLAELETQALIASDLYPKIAFNDLIPIIDEISRMLLVFGRKLRD